MKATTKERLRKDIVFCLIFLAVGFMLFDLPAFFAQRRRQEAMEIFNVVDNFSVVDQIVLSLDSEILLTINIADEHFAELKSYLDPSIVFRGAELTAHVRELRSLAVKHLTVDYFSENQLLFAVNIYLFSGYPRIENIGFGMANSIFAVQGFDDISYGAGFINNSDFMAGFGFAFFDFGLLKEP